ncbi:PaaI family thioesterase [Silicimonas algicola]|uniref:Acyl-coenzyme A thioesterase PaaI-like protein n=1 Tax=Silicimonas algicola TaxID=1826607 RepID=A0A316G1B9_9RHOB|nr:PaaI family thioesterase [Silicimonas algicola]AZQ68330.1 PaaI family thioesterase [Silicimonas algicola]PWK53600.1 acyl-coenzyme A thioesterase PaaI-like protein [Silicimonas algicola]
MDAFDFAAHGWKLHDQEGFLGLIGPVWEREEDLGPALAFQAGEKHRNKRGVVQGGMLMTVADRLIGNFARSRNLQRPQATIQLDVHFLAAVKIGDVVMGRAEMMRDTRALMFLRGELCVAERVVVIANGVWKKLDT